MLKKLSASVLVVLLLSQIVVGVALASEDNQQLNIRAKITRDIQLQPFGRQISYRYLDVLINTYLRYGNFSRDIIDVKVALRNYTDQGPFDVAIISHSRTGVKYLDIFAFSNGKMTRVFSGNGSHVKLDAKSFSIGNIKNDGRFYYEAYTYTWRDGRFLRTGYSKTYIRNWNDFFYDYGYDYYYDHYIRPRRPEVRPERPSQDERINVARSLINARMAGKDGKEYLSENLKKELGSKGVVSLIPYGRLTVIDIFESERGDWVVAVIKDSWGTDRVFKLVPVEEKGAVKIDAIIEIPKAN